VVRERTYQSIVPFVAEERRQVLQELRAPQFLHRHEPLIGEKDRTRDEVVLVRSSSEQAEVVALEGSVPGGTGWKVKSSKAGPMRTMG
jgi:hypothetical protein